MAGITGIFIKNRNSHYDLSIPIQTMMNKMSFSNDQLKQTFSNERVALGNVVPLSSKINDHFIYNNQLDLFIVVDGLVYVSNDIKQTIINKYGMKRLNNDYELIPYIYNYYKEEFIKYITGWYNIFVYDNKSGCSILINDPLGYLPLYYYETADYFLFSSKLESILSSGLMNSIEIDSTTLTEHLFFNYPLSDYTYIKNVKTLPNANIIQLSEESVSRKKYWTIQELYSYDPAGEKQSIELVNVGLKNALQKINLPSKEIISVSLTGGWDSRVVLSYFLPEQKSKIALYSFGAPESSDITIPRYIAEKENMEYTPYILDQNYLDNSFIQNAIYTILLSNGTRNYKRTHYIYAIRQIANVSDILVTGIFGDEVFKVSQAVGGTVISRNALNLLNYDYDINRSLSDLKYSGIYECLNTNKAKAMQEMEERLLNLKEYMKMFENTSQKYYSFRFEYNLRKYFGNEVNSYNDFLYCFSPFIDLDFLKSFAQTRYFGIYSSFNSNSIVKKKLATKLYYKITQMNYSPLTEYNSSRGYSMKDSVGLIGQIKIIYRKKTNKIVKFDGFNTNSVDYIFYNNVLLKEKSEDLLNYNERGTHSNQQISDLNSLIFWITQIRKLYLTKK